MYAAKPQSLVDRIQKELLGRTFERKAHAHIAATYFAIALETRWAIHGGDYCTRKSDV